MLGTIPLTPTFSRNRSSAEGLLRLDFGSHGRWLQMRGETNWVNDLRMHISLGIFINLILKELLLQSIAVIVLAKKKQKTASGFFTTVQIGGQGEVINLDVRRWLRKSGPSHLQDQHGCRELKNKVFEPCLWQCFCSGLWFSSYTSCWNLRMKGLMNHLQNKKVMRGFLQHLNVHVQSQARVFKPWLKASHKQMMSLALRKSGDLCRLCGKSQQDVGLSSEPINCCHVPLHFPGPGRNLLPATKACALLSFSAKWRRPSRSHQYPFGSVNVVIFLALSNKLNLLDVFGGLFLGRTDGRIGGCNEGICWRCMKRAMAPSRLVKCVFRRQGP